MWVTLPSAAVSTRGVKLTIVKRPSASPNGGISTVTWGLAVTVSVKVSESPRRGCFGLRATVAATGPDSLFCTIAGSVGGGAAVLAEWLPQPASSKSASARIFIAAAQRFLSENYGYRGVQNPRISPRRRR